MADFGVSVSFEINRVPVFCVDASTGRVSVCADSPLDEAALQLLAMTQMFLAEGVMAAEILGLRRRVRELESQQPREATR